MKRVAPEIRKAVRAEAQRQEEHLELIASENYCSLAVQMAQGSCLTNKYAEWYPHRRWYGGCEMVDIAESLAIEGAKKLQGGACYEDRHARCEALHPQARAGVARRLSYVSHSPQGEGDVMSRCTAYRATRAAPPARL